jgi:protein-arginine kinase activator protein McsA
VQDVSLQTRLCPECYGEAPVHRVSWQHQGLDQCDSEALLQAGRHKLVLLSACPVCGTSFRTPALWNNEPCQGCGLAFEQMAFTHVNGDEERA